MKWDTIEYITPNGRVLIEEYLDSLPSKHEAKVIRSICLLQEFGPSIGEPHVKHLTDGIYELRTKFSSNIFRCLFFHWHNNKLVITHGFTKKTEKTPTREIRKAQQYRADFLAQKGGK